MLFKMWSVLRMPVLCFCCQEVSSQPQLDRKTALTRLNVISDVIKTSDKAVNTSQGTPIAFSLSNFVRSFTMPTAMPEPIAVTAGCAQIGPDKGVAGDVRPEAMEQKATMPAYQRLLVSRRMRQA